MRNIKITTFVISLVLMLMLVGCQVEPVTTTITETKTSTNTTTQTITDVQTVTDTKTETKTEIKTTTVSDTTKTTSSPSSTSTTTTESSSVTQTTTLPEVMSSDGNFRLGATKIYEAFGGVMITGTVYNLTDKKCNVEVTITVYDAKGEVFGSASATVYSLEPDVEGTYKINCTVPFVGVYSYSLDALAV